MRQIRGVWSHPKRVWVQASISAQDYNT
uniref:Uncharacterized protein n=1 Tax=Anguilla anguilla TaxID=7936 RepID=A0A0E9XPY4_ANGAN